jgi:hypothetical protein
MLETWCVRHLDGRKVDEIYHVMVHICAENRQSFSFGEGW